MNRYLGVVIAGVILAGCGITEIPPARPPERPPIVPATVLWMEWPAQVTLGQPYQVRVVIEPLCAEGELSFRAVVTGDALTFDSRYVNVRSASSCEPPPIYAVIARDAQSLSGEPRELTVRATSLQLDSLRLFGSLRTVVAARTDTTVLAAGEVTLIPASPGCARIEPGGRNSVATYQLEGTASGISTWPPAWVEGYITRGTTSCSAGPADTLTFHRTVTP